MSEATRVSARRTPTSSEAGSAPALPARAPPPFRRVFATTMEALLAPRRLVANMVVVVPLLVLQWKYSREPMALSLAVLMCTAFFLAAPTLWRYLFPPEGPRGPAPLGIAAYGAAGFIAIFGIGWLIPALAKLGRTFLTTGPTLSASLALFWVGGWGLARDIDLERGLEESRARAAALEREADHAQLLALRSHLDPHFLFNTLNAIAEWCRTDGAVAEKAIVRLSSMLRTVMSGIRATSWPLSKELELVDTLFEMYLIRDPELFVYVRDVPRDLPEIEVPPMILLPIAENAMKHGAWSHPASGAPGARRRGEVSVRARLEDRTLTVEIANPGAFGGRRDGGSGIGIVERRLALAYGDAAAFTVAAAGERTLATLRVPREAQGAGR